jgi:hypothetical protein
LSPWVATVMTICTDKPHNKCTRYARKGLQPISHNKSSSKARDTRHTKQNPPGHFCEPRHRTTCSVVYNGPGGPDAHTPPRQGMVAPNSALQTGDRLRVSSCITPEKQVAASAAESSSRSAGLSTRSYLHPPVQCQALRKLCRCRQL